MLIVWTKYFKNKGACQFFLLSLGQEHKLLVAWAVGKEREVHILKGLLEAQRLLVRLLAEFVVTTILEKGVELQAQEPSLRQNRAVLLHVGAEATLEAVIGKHHRFPKEGTAFGTANGEGIAESRQVPQRYVVVFAA